ncbi:MAG: hypothetical protein WAW33_02395 [Minisyncoccia bacterium]
MSDILIKNGWVFNGRSESILSRADLLIEKGVITSIENNIPTKGVTQVINAEGKIISPGFIDLNSQVDSFSLDSPTLESSFLIRQGITTVVVGNTGKSAMRYLIPKSSGYSSLRSEREGANQKENLFTKYSQSSPAVNIDSFLGWETIQEWGIKNALQLKAFFAKSQHKLTGISVEYNSRNQEKVMSDIKEIASFLGQVGGSLIIYAPDMYISSDTLSLWGQISLENKVPFIIDNDILGRDKNGENLLEETQKQNLLGAKICFMLWPYDFIPIEIDRVITLLENDQLNLKNVVPEFSNSLLIGSQIPKELKGKTLKEIADNWSLDILETLKRIRELWPSVTLQILIPYTISFNWWADKFTYTSLKTELIEGGNIHAPNSLSGFNYFLSKFISKSSPELWPGYLAKITSQPALLAGLPKRGFLQKDYLADIVIINPDTLDAKGDYENPQLEGKGIETVIIDGHLVWHKGRGWDKGAGKLLI